MLAMNRIFNKKRLRQFTIDFNVMLSAKFTKLMSWKISSTNPAKEVYLCTIKKNTTICDYFLLNLTKNA